MKYGFVLLISLFLFLSFQVADNDLTDNFTFQVQSIDDFIDRFNYDQETEFMKTLKERYNPESISRKRLLLSLFNRKNYSFSNNSEVADFITDVTDTVHPRFIHFSDYEWYALLECKIVYQKRSHNLELILKVERGLNKSTKWSIVSAMADFLEDKKSKNGGIPEEIRNDYLVNRMKDSSRYFLHPVSHAIDFMNVDEAFLKKRNFSDYLYNGPKTPELLSLSDKVQKSQIRFLQVNTVSYHLLQIKDWIVIVDYFNRNEKNSGWLINTLLHATSSQKRIYLKNHLNIPIN